MKNPLNGFMKETILKNAAKAMASWFVENGITAADLEQQIRSGAPVLDNAMRAVPKEKIGGVRAMVAPVIQQFTHDDYARILTYLWEFEPCQDHALLLRQPDMFWHHFQPAMEKVKTWLATGSPQ